MASMGKSLDEVYYECALIKKRMATLGVTVKPCNMPGLGLMFEIEEGFMEVGIGIHGEAGASKMRVSYDSEIIFLVEYRILWSYSENMF